MCEPAFDNLLGAVNDWALKLAADGRRNEALSLLEAATAAAPRYEPLRVNYRYLSRHDTATLQREALNVLQKTAPNPGFSRD